VKEELSFYKEWIALALFAYRGQFAVAGDDYRLVGRASTVSCRERMIFCIEPPGRSVRPMEPAKRVSPAISFFSAAK
jgi:hypothetical protein